MTESLFNDQEQSSFFEETPKVITDPKVVSYKTGVVSTAAESLGMPTEAIPTEIQAGREDTIRQAMSLEEAKQTNEVTQEVAQSLIEDPTVSTETIQDFVTTEPDSMEVNAKSVVERKAAESITTAAEVNNAFMAHASPEYKEFVERSLAQDMILKNVMEGSASAVKDDSIPANVGDLVEKVVGVYNQYLESDVDEVQAGTILTSTGYNKIREKIYAMDPKDLAPFVQDLDYELSSRGLFGTNNMNRSQFWFEVVSGGESWDKSFWLGAEQALDILPYAGTAMRGIRNLARGRVSVKKGVGDLNGAVDDARTIQKAIADDLLNPAEPDAINALEEGLPSHINPMNLGEEEVGLASRITDAQGYSRLSEADTMKAVDEALAKGEEELNKIPSDFIDEATGTRVETNIVRDSKYIGTDKEGIPQVSFTIDKEGVPFFDADVAEVYATEVLRLQKGDFRVVENEGGVFINVTRDVETEGLKFTTPLEGTKGGIWSFFSRDTTVDPLMSLSTHGASPLRSKLAQTSNDLLKPIRALSGNDREIFDLIGVKARRENGGVDYTVEDLRGMVFEVNGKMVSVADRPQIIKAYEADRLADQIHATVLNEDIVRTLNNHGYKNISFKDGDVNGKVLDSVPDSAIKDFYDISTGKKVGNLSNDELKALQDDGYQVVKLLEDAGLKVEGQEYTYILAKKNDFTVGNLKRDQLAKTKGGRIHYEGTHRIEQQNVRAGGEGQPNFITRPSTRHIGSVSDMEQGATVLEDLRRLYKSVEVDKTIPANVAELDRAIQKITQASRTDLVSWDRVKKAFAGEAGERPKYNWREPFEVVQVGKRSERLQKLLQDEANKFDAEDIEIHNSLQDGVALRGFGSKSKRTEGLRDLDGTEAKIVSPAMIAERVLQQAAYVKGMKPLKQQMADKWAKAYKGMFDQAMIRGLNSEEIMEIASRETMKYGDGDPARVGQALMAKKHWDNFTNVETQAEKVWKEWMHTTANGIGLKDNTEILGKNVKELMTSSNPLQAVKGYTFHTTLGALSPHNFLLQGSALFAAASMEPVRMAKAVMLLPLMNARVINKTAKVTDHLAQKIAKMQGLDMSHKSVRQLLDDMYNAGHYIVKGEHNLHRDVQHITASRKMMAGLEDISAAPFNFIERQLSMSSYAAAWIKWHDDNPGKILSKAGREANDEVLKYADLLMVNMRTSGANLTQGRGLVGAIAQMGSYPQHWVETFAHKELTKTQKASFATSQLALWGVGGTLGTSALPVTESISNIVEYFTGEKPSQEVIKTIHSGVIDEVLLKNSDIGFSSKGGAALLDNFLFNITDPNIMKDKSLGIGFGKAANLVGFMSDLASLTMTLPDPEIGTVDLMAQETAIFLEKNVGSLSRLGMSYRAMRTGHYTTADGYHYEGIGLSKLEAVMLNAGFVPKDARLFWDAQKLKKGITDDIKNTVKILKSRFNRTLDAIADDPSSYEQEMKIYKDFMAFQTRGMSEEARNKVSRDLFTKDMKFKINKTAIDLRNLGSDITLEMIQGE